MAGEALHRHVAFYFGNGSQTERSCECAPDETSDLGLAECSECTLVVHRSSSGAHASSGLSLESCWYEAPAFSRVVAPATRICQLTPAIFARVFAQYWETQHDSQTLPVPKGYLELLGRRLYHFLRVGTALSNRCCWAGGSIVNLPPSDDSHRFVVAVNEASVDGAPGCHYILNVG
eukprot:COSAG05_NODE_8357_length_711_cov_1.192810_2_plen_176_part_00